MSSNDLEGASRAFNQAHELIMEHLHGARATARLVADGQAETIVLQRYVQDLETVSKLFVTLRAEHARVLEEVRPVREAAEQAKEEQRQQTLEARRSEHQQLMALIDEVSKRGLPEEAVFGLKRAANSIADELDDLGCATDKFDIADCDHLSDW